jgi:hypothetical protein
MLLQIDPHLDRVGLAATAGDQLDARGQAARRPSPVPDIETGLRASRPRATETIAGRSVGAPRFSGELRGDNPPV